MTQKATIGISHKKASKGMHLRECNRERKTNKNTEKSLSEWRELQ